VYTWDIGVLGGGLPLLLQDRSSAFVYGPGGLLLEQVIDDGAGSQSAYYYHTDHLGSVRALTNSSGTVVNEYDYDAYGNVTSQTGTTYNPFGYTGEYTDSESGLVYLRARYYDPTTQQFLTVDPALAWTEQAYAYVVGSPTNLVDPWGLGYQWDLSESMRYSIMDGVAMDLGFAPRGYGAGERGILGLGFTKMRQINNRSLGRPRDLYRTGNTKGPYPPRIEGFNIKPNQEPDLFCTADGLVVPNRGGVSTFERIDQLPTSGKVWRLPGDSRNIEGFTDILDGRPLGPHKPGHHSIQSNEPMTPEELLESFFNWGWKPVMSNDKHVTR
jgi:RHS repeat-associated protein